MLRVDNGSVMEHSNNITYASTKGKKCKKVTIETVMKSDKHVDAIKEIQDLQRRNACAVHSCIPQKKCMAKVGLHDSNGNYLTKEMIGMNVTRSLSTGGNQIGYVYQEKSISDVDRMYQALRDGTGISHSVATKLAERNAELYGKPHTWDGQHSGYFCVKCPPKPKPCPPPTKYKKADPFNAPIGLGSDVIEARDNLRDTFSGRVFQTREATPSQTQGVQTEMTTTQEMMTQATGNVPMDADRRLQQASGGRPPQRRERGLSIASQTTVSGRERDGL